MPKKKEWTLERLIERKDDAFRMSIKNLEELKEKAINDRNADAYVIACEGLGIDFDLPDLACQSRFYRKEEEMNPYMDKKETLNKIISLTEKGHIPNDFGITNSHVQRIPIRPLTDIWYGMNNVKIPTTMLAAMDGQDILATYLSAGKKQYQMMDIPDDFPALCETIESSARKDTRLKGSLPSIKTYFTRPRKDLLMLVPKPEQAEFMESYRKPHIPSLREDSIAGAEYDLPEGGYKNFYADNTIAKIKSDYGSVQAALRMHGIRNR